MAKENTSQAVPAELPCQQCWWSIGEIERLRARVAELEAANAWQPIETAPESKNPSVRFLAHVAGHGAVVCWKNFNGHIFSVATNAPIVRATRWRPLPQPPEKNDEE